MSRKPLGFAYLLTVHGIRPLLVILTRRDWRGAEHLPEAGGFVVTPNHLSHVDPLTFAHFLYNNGRPPRFLAKSALFRIPIVGWVVRNAGQIPVYRESRNAAEAFSGAVAAIKAGECVVIYPEGTLTRDPALWPMVGKTGAARVALATGCPVIPVAQWGPQQMLPPYSRRLRVLRRTPVQVTAGPPVDLEDLRGLPVTPDVLRIATERILARITTMLAELRGEPAPAQLFDPRAEGVARIGRPHHPTARSGGVREAGAVDGTPSNATAAGDPVRADRPSAAASGSSAEHTP